MKEEQPTFNALDPGPLPSLKPKRRFTWCKCITWSILLLLASGVCYLVVTFVPPLLENMTSPHAHAYVKETTDLWDETVEVKPLVDANQTFDVSATVWTREPGGISEDYEFFTENILFSDIIFRGFTYDEKDRSTAVNLTIPLSLLYAPFVHSSFSMILRTALQQAD